MAGQAVVNGMLQITNGSQQYQSRPNSFLASVSGVIGPTPGAMTVPLAGLDISIPQLTSMGGLVWIQNVDPTNYLTLGTRDTITNEFYPFCELLPGECYVFRSSRKIPKHEMGTGTFSGTNVTYHAKPDTAPVVLRWDHFDP